MCLYACELSPNNRTYIRRDGRLCSGNRSGMDQRTQHVVATAIICQANPVTSQYSDTINNLPNNPHQYHDHQQAKAGAFQFPNGATKVRNDCINGPIMSGAVCSNPSNFVSQQSAGAKLQMVGVAYYLKMVVSWKILFCVC